MLVDHRLIGDGFVVRMQTPSLRHTGDTMRNICARKWISESSGLRDEACNCICKISVNGPWSQVRVRLLIQVFHPVLTAQPNPTLWRVM